MDGTQRAFDIPLRHAPLPPFSLPSSSAHIHSARRRSITHSSPPALASSRPRCRRQNFTEEDIVDSPVAAATLASEFKRAEERRKRRAEEDRQEARATADFDDMVARGAEEERVKAAGASAAPPPQPVERVRSGIGAALALAPATSLAADAADTASAAAAAARGAEEGGAEVAGADLDAVARSLSASPRAQERMLSALFGGFSFTSPSLLSSVGPALGAAKEEADDEEEVEDKEDEEASEHSIGEQAREIRGC